MKEALWSLICAGATALAVLAWGAPGWAAVATFMIVYWVRIGPLAPMKGDEPQHSFPTKEK